MENMTLMNWLLLKDIAKQTNFKMRKSYKLKGRTDTMIHTIQSNALKVDINPTGAELYSIQSKKTGTEYLWQGDPAWWGRRAPILFPILCSLKNDAYTYNGKTYNMPKHGFVRDAAFVTRGAEGDKITFEYSDNEETRKIYPFAFLLQIIFQVEDNRLATTYRVENRGDATMYFSVGAHEAYRCPREADEAFEDYYLEFDKDGTYISEQCNSDGLISGKTHTVIENGRVIPLTHQPFAEYDTLIFKNVPSSRVFLKSKKSATVVEVDYEDAPHLGIWQRPGAPYICIEPWYGLPDEATHDGRIENKYGIVALPAGEAFAWKHTIVIHE